MHKVLLEKYRLKDCESRSLTDFLMCMLKWKPKDRADARELLKHPWLKETDDYSVWMSKPHLREFKMVNASMFPAFIEELRVKKVEEEGKAAGLSVDEIEKLVKEEQSKIDTNNKNWMM